VLQTVAEATLALLIYALQTEIVAYYAAFIITPALNSPSDSIHPECVCLYRTSCCSELIGMQAAGVFFILFSAHM